jgi:large subunit ribosomal protein L1
MGKPKIKEINNSLEETKVQPEVLSETKTIDERKKPVKTKQVGKRLKSLYHKIDRRKKYNLAEALGLVKETSNLNFDSTVEVHINLATGPNQKNQPVRGTVALPHGTGKKAPRILVFANNCPEELKKENVIVGDAKDIEKIQKGWLDFDKVVASPEMMSLIGKVAKQLGPKGLMPNPKSGTVTSDVAKTVKEIVTGLVEFKSESSPIIHTVIGKVSMENNMLTENFIALMESVNKAKPNTIKTDFIKSVFLSGTMGPSIEIDLTNSE